MKTMKSFKSAIAPKMRVSIRAILFGIAFLSTNCFAKQAPPRADILAKFTGYYQLPDKASFIQFELKDNVLLAQWDHKEYELIQLNETSFETKKEGYKVEFLKDGSGEFVYAKLLGKITSVKVGFDPKTIKPLSAAQLKRLEGTYKLKDKDFEIDIRPSANGLTLKQLWDNKEIAFTPRSETFFLNDDGTFPLTFLLENGEATQLTCFKEDAWQKVK